MFAPFPAESRVARKECGLPSLQEEFRSRGDRAGGRCADAVCFRDDESWRPADVCEHSAYSGSGYCGHVSICDRDGLAGESLSVDGKGEDDGVTAL